MFEQNGQYIKTAKRVAVIVFILTLCFRLSVNADDGGYLVKLKSGFYPDPVEYDLREVNAVRGIYAADSVESLKNIKESIEYISENNIVTLIEGEKAKERMKGKTVPFSLPIDELYAEQWQLQMVGADSGWELETYGNYVRVAVIDSGCFAHDDLKNNLLEGKNYLTGNSDVTDNVGHGTHVSGIIAAEMNGAGIIGIAPKARIVPLKCFDPSYSTQIEDLISAIYDAVDIYDCQVINMSWGLKENNPFLKEAIEYADSKGVIMTAAVGNSGSDVLYYPAAYDNVIGVGSIDWNKNHSAFSQSNKSVMISAPGENILSAYNDGHYYELRGTSQASPVIAGIAAIALSMNETLTSEQFKKMVAESAEDLGDEGWDEVYGYGLVDEKALIELILQKASCYVSPVNIEENIAYVLIRNNSESIIDSVSIFARYTEDKFISSDQMKILLPPGKEVIVKTVHYSQSLFHIICSDLKRMRPIALKREYIGSYFY